MSQIHMITGLTGAGKSTYAAALTEDLGGIRMSIDDWMATLFFMDRDPTTDFNWFYDRVQRCCLHMRNMADQIAPKGTPIILDCGFTNRQEREIFYNWADEQGFSVTLHFLDVDPETRWQRVENRNAERGPTFALTVTREMFDFMQTIWEAPSEDEMATRNGQLV